MLSANPSRFGVEKDNIIQRLIESILKFSENSTINQSVWPNHNSNSSIPGIFRGILSVMCDFRKHVRIWAEIKYLNLFDWGDKMFKILFCATHVAALNLDKYFLSASTRTIWNGEYMPRSLHQSKSVRTQRLVEQNQIYFSNLQSTISQSQTLSLTELFRSPPVSTNSSSWSNYYHQPCASSSQVEWSSLHSCPGTPSPSPGGPQHLKKRS